MVLSEKEFTHALRSSNKAVFEQVFKGYYERLCNYANTFLNDMDDAEEIVQGMFLGLWEKRGAIQVHSSVKPYLYQTVHNACINHIDHQKVKRKHSQYIEHHAEVFSDSVAQTAIANELEEEIEKAIASLPPQCQTVFRLSRFEGLSYSEIALQLNVSEKTIENHMGKALRIMREKLKDYLPFLLWVLFRN